MEDNPDDCTVRSIIGGEVEPLPGLGGLVEAENMGGEFPSLQR